MEPPEKYLSDYEVTTEREREFRLIPSSAKQYFITLGLLGGILIVMIFLVIFVEMPVYMLIYAILVSWLVIFVTPILWNKVFRRIVLFWTNLDIDFWISLSDPSYARGVVKIFSIFW